MTYHIGDEVRLTLTFTDGADPPNNVDPTAVVLIVKKPDGTRVSYKSAGFVDQDTWDASTNTPALADGTGTAGHFYTVSVAGTVDFGDGDIVFAVDDEVFYNGVVWRKIPSPSSTALTNDSVGVYHVDQWIGQAGDWNASCETVQERAGDYSQFSARAKVA